MFTARQVGDTTNFKTRLANQIVENMVLPLHFVRVSGYGQFLLYGLMFCTLVRFLRTVCVAGCSSGLLPEGGAAVPHFSHAGRAADGKLHVPAWCLDVKHNRSRLHLFVCAFLPAA
jgi:hypothetical protein